MDATQFSELIKRADSLIDVSGDGWVQTCASLGAIAAVAISAYSVLLNRKGLNDARDRELRPLILPESNGVLPVGDEPRMSIAFHNVGRGIAKGLHVTIGDYPVEWNLPYITPNDTREVYIPSEEAKDTITEILKRREPTLLMRMEYADIYNRVYRTVAKLELQGDNYVLDRGWWDVE